MAVSEGATRGTWARRAVLAVLLIAVVAALVYWWRPLYAFVSQPERLREWIAQFGPWAPLVAIGIQMVQVVVAPVPGDVINIVDGYLFGMALGTLYSMIGASLGTMLGIWLARRFGRPLVVRLVNAEKLARLDRYVQRAGPPVLFLLFLLPFLPDDTLCLLAGLTTIPLPVLFAVTIPPRLPKILVGTALGASAGQLTPVQWVIVGIIVLALGVPILLWREKIEDLALRLVSRLSRKK